MKLLFSTLLFFFAFCIASAQPHQYDCQYWRTNGGQFRGIPSSASARMGENRSIAFSDTFDILHYDISIDVTDYARRFIVASTTIRFVPKMDDCPMVSFDLKDLTVDSVTNASGQLVFSHNDDLLRIYFPAPYSTGDTTELTVHYHGFPYADQRFGGLHFESGYIYNLGIGIDAIPPNFGKAWYPCFDSFVERAMYTYHVKSAGGFEAHCQGDLVEEVQLDGDTVIRTYDFPYTIPTHLSAIAASDYHDMEYIHEGEFGPVPVRLTARPGDTATMRTKFRNLGAAIDAGQHWYGKTGWARVGYVMAVRGALEIPENIVFPLIMLQTPDIRTQNLYAHELGHYWWGDWIVPYIHNDMWIKEGPAEYTSHLTVEWLSGHEAFVDAVKSNHYTVLTTAHTRVSDGDFFPLSPMPDSVIYGDHTYKKGASVMHNLRGYLGDSLFRRGLTAVQYNNPHTAFTADMFRAALEEETGVDLDPFFNDQVYAPGFSAFVVDSFTVNPSGNEYSVRLFIRQKLRKVPHFYTHVPIDVTFVSASGQREELLIEAGDEFTEVELSSPFVPAMVVLNGHNRLNQARMDHERKIGPGSSSTSQGSPYVDFTLRGYSLSDTALLRVEHIWSAPDTTLKSRDIRAISPVHYWTVDGLWPEGAQFSAQLNYRGLDAQDPDYSLYRITEEKAVLAYRETAADPWAIYPHYTLGGGSLTNALGNFQISNLKKGQYAFANSVDDVGLTQVLRDLKTVLTVYPNPAAERVTVLVNAGGIRNGTLCITAIDGRVYKVVGTDLSGEQQFDVSGLGNGCYLLQLMDAEGNLAGMGRFVIAR